MDLEFIRTRTSQWVPIVNGTLLHSSVDPRREAEDLVEREWDRISTVKSLIVFGLGGGFHIHEILRRKNFDVVVIEAEKNLAMAMREKDDILFSRASVLAGMPPAQLCDEPAVLKALSRSYAVLKHPASLRVTPFYYSAVIQMLNERTVYRLLQLTKGNSELLHFLESLDIASEQILTLPMVEEAMIRRGTGLDKEGLIWMAMRELIV